MTDPADLLDLLRDRAPGLRAAGVTSVEVREDGSFSATLRPPDPPQAAAPQADAGQQFPPANPLDDPDTFGGSLPKRRPMLYDDDEEKQS